jgi:hypothetical protein
MTATPHARVMASLTETFGRRSGPSGVTLIDPRAPRFGQALTALGLLAGVLLQQPVFVFAVALVLNVAVLSGWRLDLYAFLWGRVGVSAFGRPVRREPAAPHRFARLLDAGFTLLASLLLFVGAPLAGFAVAGLVSLLAGVAAGLGHCVGCKLYRRVAFFRRLGVV